MVLGKHHSCESSCSPDLSSCRRYGRSGEEGVFNQVPWACQCQCPQILVTHWDSVFFMTINLLSCPHTSIQSKWVFSHFGDILSPHDTCQTQLGWMCWPFCQSKIHFRPVKVRSRLPRNTCLCISPPLWVIWLVSCTHDARRSDVYMHCSTFSCLGFKRTQSFEPIYIHCSTFSGLVPGSLRVSSNHTICYRTVSVWVSGGGRPSSYHIYLHHCRLWNLSLG